MNDLSIEKTMTVKEVADVLGLNVRTIQMKVKELFPEKIKERETTYLNEKEVTLLKMGCEKKFAEKNSIRKRAYNSTSFNVSTRKNKNVRNRKLNYETKSRSI